MTKLSHSRRASCPLGADLSTLRRWNERGLLRAIKLPGGVRRLSPVDIAVKHEQSRGGLAPLREDGDVVRVGNVRSIL